DNFTTSIRGGSATLNALTGGAADLPADTEIDWDRALRNVNHRIDQMATALRHNDRGKRLAEFDRLEAQLAELKKARLDAAEKRNDPLGVDATPQSRGETIGDILVTLLTPAVRKI